MLSKMLDNKKSGIVGDTLKQYFMKDAKVAIMLRIVMKNSRKVYNKKTWAKIYTSNIVTGDALA